MLQCIKCTKLKITGWKVFYNYLSGFFSSIEELYNERTINKGGFLAEIRLTVIEGRLLGQIYWRKLINDSIFWFRFIFFYCCSNLSMNVNVNVNSHNL